MTDIENPAPQGEPGSELTETQLTRDEARALTNRIKVTANHVWELVEIAYTRMAWRALDYDSWDSYVAEEFGTNRLRLPLEEREEVVTSLRDAGLSVRAISAATGDSYGTVRNALKSGEESTEQNCSVEDGAQDSERPLKLILGRDGKKRRPAKKPARKLTPDELSYRATLKSIREAQRENAKAQAQEPDSAPIVSVVARNVVTSIISELDRTAERIAETLTLLHKQEGGINPTQRRDLGAAITRLAEAIGMRFEGITFDDGGFVMATPEPEGP